MAEKTSRHVLSPLGWQALGGDLQCPCGSRVSSEHQVKIQPPPKKIPPCMIPSHLQCGWEGWSWSFGMILWSTFQRRAAKPSPPPPIQESWGRSKCERLLTLPPLIIICPNFTGGGRIRNCKFFGKDSPVLLLASRLPPAHNFLGGPFPDPSGQILFQTKNPHVPNKRKNLQSKL